MQSKIKFFSEERPAYISPKNNKYSADELANFIQKEGALIDYKSIEGNLKGTNFHEPLPQEDIHLLLENEKILEAYQNFVTQNGGRLVPSVSKINDKTLELLKSLVSSGRELVQEGWQYMEDSTITAKIGVPLKELNAFLEDDDNVRQRNALNEVADFLGYNYARGVDFSMDVGNVYEKGGCSSGFIPMVSKMTALIESVGSYLEFERKAATKNEM